MPVLLIMRPRVDFSLHLSVSLFLSLSLFPQLLDMILPPQHHCIVLQISSQSALCCAVCAVRSLCMTGLNGRDIGALECSHFFLSLVTLFYLWSLPEIVRNSGCNCVGDYAKYDDMQMQHAVLRCLFRRRVQYEAYERCTYVLCRYARIATVSGYAYICVYVYSLQQENGAHRST